MSKTIVIDAGHGGDDPGAVKSDIFEKDIVLKWSNCLTDLFESDNIIPVRTKDKFVNLNTRAKFANDHDADLFISLHCNAAGAESANGIETFHYPGSTGGQRLANSVQQELIKKTGRRDRGVKTAEFAVLRHTNMPAILVECGFITNEDERFLMQEDSYIYALSMAIKEGIYK